MRLVGVRELEEEDEDELFLLVVDIVRFCRGVFCCIVSTRHDYTDSRWCPRCRWPSFAVLYSFN